MFAARAAKLRSWMKPAIGIADSKGFNPRELAVIIREVIKNQSAIERAWDEHFRN